MTALKDDESIEPVVETHENVEAREDSDDQKIMERSWGLDARVDSTVTFEEFAYWAEIERADEMERNRQYIDKRGPRSVANVLKGRFSHGIHHEEKKEQEKAAKEGDGAGVLQHSNDLAVTDEEWKTAARALKTASWGTVFFLITTDILGWASTPYVSK